MKRNFKAIFWAASLSIIGVLSASAQTNDLTFLTKAKSLGDPCLKAMENKMVASYVDEFCLTQYNALLAEYQSGSTDSASYDQFFGLYGSAILHVLIANEMVSNGGVASDKLCGYAVALSNVAELNPDWSGFGPADSIQSTKKVMDEHVIPICIKDE